MFTIERILSRGNHRQTIVHPFCQHGVPVSFVRLVSKEPTSSATASGRPVPPMPDKNAFLFGIGTTFERPRQPFGVLCAPNRDLVSFMVAQGRTKWSHIWKKIFSQGCIFLLALTNGLLWRKTEKLAFCDNSMGGFLKLSLTKEISGWTF